MVDTKIRALQPNKKISEAVGLGGSLVVKRNSGNKRTFYYRRRRKDQKDLMIRVGIYHQKGEAGGITLVEARKIAEELAVKLNSATDIKNEKKRLDSIALATASNELLTFEKVLDDYTDGLKKANKSSYKNVWRSFERYVKRPFAHLLPIPAKDIKPIEIAIIIKSMEDQNITTTINRLRDSLHAAFAAKSPFYKPGEGMSLEHDKEQLPNPVAQIKRQSAWERTGDRVLSETELSIVWRYCVPYMGTVYGNLLKTMICTGCRPSELMEHKGYHLNVEEKSLLLITTKNDRPNLIPIPKIALHGIVHELYAHLRKDESIFPSSKLDAKMTAVERTSILANKTAQFIETVKTYHPDLTLHHFAPRDIRRSVKTFMGKAKLSKEMKNRLQNHSLNDVATKHYDRYDYWDQKKEASAIWENWLIKNVVKPSTKLPDPVENAK